MWAIAFTEATETVSVYVCSFSDVIDKVGPLWEEIKNFVDVVFVPYGKSEVFIKYFTKRYILTCLNSYIAKKDPRRLHVDEIILQTLVHGNAVNFTCQHPKKYECQVFNFKSGIHFQLSFLKYQHKFCKFSHILYLWIQDKTHRQGNIWHACAVELVKSEDTR